jgi:hypothetical protein
VPDPGRVARASAALFSRDGEREAPGRVRLLPLLCGARGSIPFTGSDQLGRAVMVTSVPIPVLMSSSSDQVFAKETTASA